MGRKKKTIVALKPFCYYCDKEFNNEIVLHQHQKARHFNCKNCRKRFSTAPALDTHVLQVHKEKLNRVPNAKAERDLFDISIYGMDGVPIELINVKLAMKVGAKKKRLILENQILADEEDLKDLKKKKDHGKKTKDIDMKSILQQGGGFYHNPDSINLTLNKNQMNSMYNKNQMNSMYPNDNTSHDPKNLFMNYIQGGPMNQMNTNPMMNITPIPLGQIRQGLPIPFGHPGNMHQMNNPNMPPPNHMNNPNMPPPNQMNNQNMPPPNHMNNQFNPMNQMMQNNQNNNTSN